jgi:hypothetical protein
VKVWVLLMLIHGQMLARGGDVFETQAGCERAFRDTADELAQHGVNLPAHECRLVAVMK